MYSSSLHKKVPVKNTLNFEKYKINKFLTKRHTMLILLYFHLLSQICLFYISQNTTYFLTGLFLHTPLLYIFIYIFNAIIFWDLETWDFKISKNLKLKRALMLMCQRQFPKNACFIYHIDHSTNLLGKSLSFT
jgi:hypothetical protein